MPFEVQRDRVSWVDAAKAVGIILIVAGHANRSVSRTEGLEWSAVLQFFDAVLYAFHVPLFFVLAGLASALARPGWRNAIQSIVLGVVLPYLIWSVIWIWAKASLPGDLVNRPLSLSDITQIFWAPVDHFWFLFHLILIRLFWLGAERMLTPTSQRIVLGALAALSIGLRALGENWTASAHFLENTVFFGVGLIAVSQLGTTMPTWRHFPLAVVSTAVFAVAFWLSHVFGLAALTIFASFFGVSAVILFVLAVEKRLSVSASRAVQYVGQASLVIFLVHGFAIGASRASLKYLNWLTPETLVIAGTLAGVAVPLIGYYVVTKLSLWSETPIMTWIGWGRWRAPTAQPVPA